jgi:hypothetical protein
MGGPSASGDINAAIATYLLLAEGLGNAESISGKYWYQSNIRTPKKEAENTQVQQSLLDELEKIIELSLPEA